MTAHNIKKRRKIMKDYTYDETNRVNTIDLDANELREVQEFLNEFASASDAVETIRYLKTVKRYAV